MESVRKAVAANPCVAVIDDDPDFCKLIECHLEEMGYRALCYLCGDEAVASAGLTGACCVLLDLNLPGTTGIETLRAILQRHPHLPVIMMTADEAVANIVLAIRAGAYDYLTKPPAPEKLRTALRNAVEKHKLTMQVIALSREAHAGSYEGIIGRSATIRQMLRNIEKIAATDISVLIRGESGTGKELVARAIHQRGARKDGPFMAMNAAAVPETLFEAELFGYEKGAFTGAAARRKGRIEEASGGTLFLDEIAEIPLAMQAKLLRVIQEREFQRLGGSDTLTSDFRLIAATHRDLNAEVEAGRFREDLYFRIAVLDLDVPALRERRSDIPLLTAAFMELYSAGRSCSISEEAMKMLWAYSWPGNVRELQNAVQRAVLLCDSAQILPEHLPSHLVRNAGAGAAGFAGQTIQPAETMEQVERTVIEETLIRSSGNVSEAMRHLKMGRNRFYRKLRKYNLQGLLDQLRTPQAESGHRDSPTPT